MNGFMNYGYGPPLPLKKRRKKRKQQVVMYMNYGYGPVPVPPRGYGYGPIQPKKRRKRRIVRQPTIGQDIAGIAKQWETRGKKVYKGYKQAKKATASAYEAHKKRKAEGRDTVTLTKHYAGQVKQFVRPKRSMYYQKKKGIGSKLKGLFGKKKKGIYEE